MPGVGPKTVRLLHRRARDRLGRRAAGRCRGRPAASGEGALGAYRAERPGRDRAHRERSTRLLLHDADALVGALVAALREVAGVRRIEPAGSLRRRRATIGDLDLLAAVDDPAAVIARARRPAGGASASSRPAPTSRASSCATGRRSTSWSARPRRGGATSSTSPAARTTTSACAAWRSIVAGRSARRASTSSRPVSSSSTPRRRTCTSASGLPWIPPELREGSGEIEAALAGELPRLVTLDDVRGDTHTHSNWTDGVDSIEVMARAARDLGHEYIVLTDHSPSLGVARGLVPERVEEQRAEIARVNAELAPFRVLHGTELEIRADATLDYPDELLARFDVVIASIHTGRSQSPEQLTTRALAAVEHPHVDVLAHPSGRIVNRRDPLPLDWPRVFEAAARSGTALEINGSPRLDLDDTLARAAGRAGAHADAGLRRAPHGRALHSSATRSTWHGGRGSFPSRSSSPARPTSLSGCSDDRSHLCRSPAPQRAAPSRSAGRGRDRRPAGRGGGRGLVRGSGVAGGGDRGAARAGWAGRRLRHRSGAA